MPFSVLKLFPLLIFILFFGFIWPLFWGIFLRNEKKILQILNGPSGPVDPDVHKIVTKCWMMVVGVEISEKKLNRLAFQWLQFIFIFPLCHSKPRSIFCGPYSLGQFFFTIFIFYLELLPFISQTLFCSFHQINLWFFVCEKNYLFTFAYCSIHFNCNDTIEFLLNLIKILTNDCPLICSIFNFFRIQLTR